jgi:arylsulfatase A-like enzyme
MAETRPNFILVMADQLRGDAVGMDGNFVTQTPNIDALMSRGTRFSHAYTACPSCLPTRATLWTGMNQWHTGLLGMGRGQGPIPNDFPHTLPGELVKASYFAQMVGKGHFSPQRALMGFSATELDESGRVESEGFVDDYRMWWSANAPRDVTPDDHGIDWNAWQARPWHTAEHLHPTAWTMTRSLEFLRTRPKDQPFFLNISFARPHSPYVPPQAYWDMYENMLTPPAYIGNWTQIYDRPDDPLDPNAWRAVLTPEQIHRAKVGYFGEISFIDAQLGRLTNWMRRFQPQAYYNTYFIFLSDHGDMLGDHHLLRKTYAYEGSARVPLVISPPYSRSAARRVAGEVVELRDVMPTILDMAGVPCPSTVDGASLVPLMNGPAADWRAYLHGEHCNAYGAVQEMQYVTDGLRKFIWLPRINREQYFNLETDPGECFDRINDPSMQSEIATWRDRLTAELSARNCGWVIDGHPFCPSDEPLISPYKTKRYIGEEI